MVKSIVEKVVQTTLVLSQKQAKWLRGIVQNPLHCSKCSRELIPEEELDTTMRHDFFKALEDSNG